MEFQRLGNSGLKVSKIVLGAMSYGNHSSSDWILDDEEQVMKLLKAAYDGGIRSFDTANVYSHGQSEILIGKFLKKYDIPRSTIVILTKCFGRANDDPRVEPTELNWINRHGLSRKHINDAVEASIKRLGTYIDVLQIHRFDKDTPIEETMEALHDLVKEGKIRYIGASSMKCYQFARMQFAAEKNGWTKFVSMQNEYNVIYREEEREMNAFCNETGVGLIPWSPVAAGYLTRELDVTTARGKSTTIEKFKDQPQTIEIIKRVKEVAQKKGVSMAQVAIAWTMEKGCAPIVGLSSVERINEAIKAVSVKLTEDEIKYLEELYKPVSAHI